MKKSLMAGVSMSALAVSALAVSALTSPVEAGNAYISLGAGIAGMNDRDWTRSSAGPPIFEEGELDLDSAAMFEGAVGFDFGTVWSKEGGRPDNVGLRVEVQVSNVKLEGDSVFFTDTDKQDFPYGGTLNEWLVIANVLVDIDLGGFTPYLGVGGGMAISDCSITPILESPKFANCDDDDLSAVWQVIAGANFPVATNLDVYLNYRLIGLPGAEYGKGDDSPGGTIDFDMDLLHAITGGIRYTFN